MTSEKLFRWTKVVLPFLIVVLYLLFRWYHAGIRFSDTGIYFYTAWQMLSGKVLYKDIFFTNLPLFPYISTVYFILTQGNPTTFFSIGAIESAVAALLIFLLSRKYKLSYFASIIALCSFLFTTWNHLQAGVENGIYLAIIFLLSGWLMTLNKKIFWAGFLWALCFSTKAYFFPVLLPLVVWVWKRHGWKILFGGITGGVLVNAAAVVSSPTEFFHQLFGYSLYRQTNFNWQVFLAFIQQDTLVISGSIFLLANFKKNPMPAAISLCFMLFLLFYKDVHYIYYGMWLPFLVLGVGQTTDFLFRWRPLQPMILGVVVLALGYTTSIFVQNYNFERINDLDAVVDKIKSEKPEYLYGLDQITPVLSYLSEVPLLAGIIDTNEYRYRSGQLDKTQLTKKALEHKTMLVSYGFNYPERNINLLYSPDMYDSALIEPVCRLSAAYRVYMQQDVNMLTLIRCY